jgi:hypothetical protein
MTGHGMRWTGIGLAIGLAASFAVAKLIAGFLYGWVQLIRRRSWVSRCS